MHFQDKSRDPQKPYRASLHAIGKHPIKPWKMHIAPLPPVPPKVYKVDPTNFKELVQELTGPTQITTTTDHHPGHRLRTVAPPPLDLVSRSQLLEPVDRIIPETNYLDDLGETERWLMGSSEPVVAGNYVDDFQLNLSPTCMSWCSFLLASPGTLSGFA